MTKASLVSNAVWLSLFAAFASGCGKSPDNAPATRTSGTNAETSSANSGAASATLAVEPLASPAGAGSTSPQLTAESGRVILSWLEQGDSGTALKMAERASSGWSEPRVVMSGTDLVVNGADVPSVRALADGTLVAHWLQEDGADPEAYKLPVSWSKDGGRTWSRPSYPNHDKKKTQHGFASLFQAPGAGLGLVWLDGRAPDGNMALWTAMYSPDGKQVSEKVIDTRVCDCCQTSAATTSDGVIVAYRDRTAEEIRDISVTRFDSGQWSAPAVVHADGWKINGCPVNGPSIDARGRDVAIAWFTAASGEGRSFAAFSHDSGRTFGQPIGVDDSGSEGQVAVALLADGAAAVSSIESGTSLQFRVRRIAQDGTRSPAIVIAEVSGMQNPRLVQGADELVFAWTQAGKGGDPRVQTARAPFAPRSGKGAQ